MKIPREDTIKTKKSLLSAAIEIFSEKGYQDTTIAEICERAGTNIASVNYHFGNKESLYKEAWQQSFWESMEAYPQDGGVKENAPPEERLKGQIRSLLYRVSDPKNKHSLFMHKEMVNPTGFMEELAENTLIPLREKTVALVRELLGNKASEMQVQFCEINIISMCINPMVQRNRELHRKTKPILERGKFIPIEMIDIEEYANHVIKFALAGIRSIREEGEKASPRKEF